MSRFDQVLDRKNTDCMKWDAVAEIYESDHDLLPFWVADMDFECPEAIKKALHKRVEHNIYGYDFVKDSYYQAIIDWNLRRHHYSIEKEDIVFSPGIVAGLYCAVQAFTKPKDTVLVQEPVYYPFFSAVKDQGRQLLSNDLLCIDHKYQMDFVDLEEKLSREDVTLMILCSPHNPIGRVWKKDELIKVAQLCIKHHVVLISDEIHGDLIYSQNQHYSLGSIDAEIANHCVQFMAPSKTFNIAGLASGYAVIKNKELRDQYINTAKSWKVPPINPFSMEATIAAYQDCDDWLDELLPYLYQNYLYLKENLEKEIPGIHIAPLEGTYLAFIDYSELSLSSDEMKQLLIDECEMALSMGETFGNGGQKHLRFNLATSLANIQEGVARMIKAIRNRI